MAAARSEGSRAALRSALLLAAAILALLGSSALSDALEAMTASYVHGESRWSKAQKSAVLWAERYLSHGEPRALRRAERALTRIDAFRRAREAITAEELDYDRARRALSAAGVPEEEHRLMILGPRHAPFSAVAEALALWTAADLTVADLRDLLASLPEASPAERARARRALEDLDERLTILESRFSETLEALRKQVGTAGRAFRWLLGLGLVIAGGSYLFRQTARIERQSVELRWFRHAVDHSTEAVGIIDASMRTVYSNAARDALFGRTPDELNALGGSLEAMRMTPEVRAALSAARAVDAEMTVLRPDGSERLARLRAAPLFDEAGELRGHIGIFHDVTEERRMQANLHKAKEAAEAAVRDKSRFLATMSHEIRTPMNAVLGMTTLVLDGPLEDEQRERLGIVRSSGRRLLRLIDDILDFSKIEAGKMTLEPVPTSVRAVAAEVLRELRPTAETKGLTLASDLDPELPPWGLADGNRLGQILFNLIGNAIKFTAHGEVRLRIRVEGAGDSTPRLRFEVSDTGIGLSEEQRGLLFRPFQQADRSTTRKFGGTGLGLAISKDLVEAMGGSMEVESEGLGRGTTFRFVIPHPRCEAPPEVGATDEPLTDADDLRILVADDDRVNQAVAQGFLAALGCTVEVVEDGAQAVARAKAEPFDVVFLDIQMPVLDGLGAARRIRAELPPERQPVLVALTANAFAEDRAACAAAGMDDFLSKPLDRSELRRKLAALPRGATARPSEEAGVA